MILEHAPFGRRGYYASFTLQGVQFGQVLAAAIFLPLAYFMAPEDFNSWGWRIPFLLSALVLIAGYFIRRGVHEPRHSLRPMPARPRLSPPSLKRSNTAGSAWY